MKKVVILGCLVFLLTGCTVNYNIEIKDNLKIKEEALIYGDEELYNSRYRTTRAKVLKEMLNIYIKDLNNKNYQAKVIEEIPYVNLNKEYNNMEEYINNSLLFNDYFDKINYTTNGKIVKIETEGFNPNEEENPGRFFVDNLDISVKCAYNVIKSNATKVDKTNTYHFIINSNTEDFKILLEYDTGSRFIANLDIYILIGVILVATAGSWFLVYRLNKKKQY